MASCEKDGHVYKPMISQNQRQCIFCAHQEPVKPRKYCYDEQCLLLAEYFLSDERKRTDYDTAVNELAQDIQDCVEGFFSSRLVQL